MSKISLRAMNFRFCFLFFSAAGRCVRGGGGGGPMEVSIAVAFAGGGTVPFVFND